MKKPLVVVCCVIVLCSLLAVPLLLKPPSTASQGEPQTTPQTTPQSTLQPTPQTTSEATPQSTTKNTPQNTPRPTPASTSSQQPTNHTLQPETEKAINYLAHTQEPYALLLLNVLYRRFGIAEFNDSLQRYDQMLASYPQPLMRIFRRVADYNNSVQTTDFNAVTDDVDRLTVPALYSDRLSLPDNYPSMLTSAKNSGGYLLTHALLATIWLEDNNCNVTVPDNFIASLYHENAALTDNGLPVTDLELEAAAFLYMAGQGTLVDDNFVQLVIATQNYDGGWLASSDMSGSSYWHASILGLIILLHAEFPAASYPPMLASTTGHNGVFTNPLFVYSITLWVLCLICMRKRTAILLKITIVIRI